MPARAPGTGTWRLSGDLRLRDENQGGGRDPGQADQQRRDGLPPVAGIEVPSIQNTRDGDGSSMAPRATVTAKVTAAVEAAAVCLLPHQSDTDIPQRPVSTRSGQPGEAGTLPGLPASWPPEAAAEELASIAEPNVFIVDDVAFIRPGHGIAAELERRVRKRYCLETRSHVLPRNLLRVHSLAHGPAREPERGVRPRSA